MLTVGDTPPSPPPQKERKTCSVFTVAFVCQCCHYVKRSLCVCVCVGGGGPVILSPLCEVLIEMVANSQSQSLT